MNKAELIDAMADGSGLSKADAKRALDAFCDATTAALKKGDRVALVGFGSFSVSDRAARKGRDYVWVKVFPEDHFNHQVREDSLMKY